MTHDHSVEEHQRLADVSAAHEETRAVVDSRDAGQRPERPHQIGLRARRAYDVQRRQSQRRAIRRRCLSADGDGLRHARYRERDHHWGGRHLAANRNFAREKTRQRKQKRRTVRHLRRERAVVVRDGDGLVTLDADQDAGKRQPRRIHDAAGHRERRLRHDDREDGEGRAGHMTSDTSSGRA